MCILINTRSMSVVRLTKYKYGVGKKDIDLTPAEFQLLLSLSNNEPVAYKNIAEYMYYKFNKKYSYGSIRQLVHRLRNKGVYIDGISGLKYKIVDEVWFI